MHITGAYYYYFFQKWFVDDNGDGDGDYSLILLTYMHFKANDRVQISKTLFKYFDI